MPPPLHYKPALSRTLSEASSTGYSGSLTVSVEGNIGAGKSTFLEYCNSRSECITFPEPVDKWTNLNGINVLSEFYSDRKRWALPFQLYAGMTLLDHYLKPTWKMLKIVERSIYSSQKIFFEHLRRSRTIEAGMCHILDEWYTRTLDGHQSRPHVIVYLRTDPEVAFVRVQSRARNEESSVSAQYIHEIHDLHEEWIAEVHAINELHDEPVLPVFVINANQPLLLLHGEYERCISLIRMLAM